MHVSLSLRKMEGGKASTSHPPAVETRQQNRSKARGLRSPLLVDPPPNISFALVTLHAISITAVRILVQIGIQLDAEELILKIVYVCAASELPET